MITVDGMTPDLSHIEILREPFFSRKLLCLLGILSSFRLVFECLLMRFMTSMCFNNHIKIKIFLEEV